MNLLVAALLGSAVFKGVRGMVSHGVARFATKAGNAGVEYAKNTFKNYRGFFTWVPGLNMIPATRYLFKGGTNSIVANGIREGFDMLTGKSHQAIKEAYDATQSAVRLGVQGFVKDPTKQKLALERSETFIYNLRRSTRLHTVESTRRMWRQTMGSEFADMMSNANMIDKSFEALERAHQTKALFGAKLVSNLAVVGFPTLTSNVIAGTVYSSIRKNDRRI